MNDTKIIEIQLVGGPKDGETVKVWNHKTSPAIEFLETGRLVPFDYFKAPLEFTMEKQKAHRYKLAWFNKIQEDELIRTQELVYKYDGVFEF